MSALFLFAAAGFFAFLALVFLFKGSKPYYPPRHRNFTAAVKYGELQVMVHYESSPDPFEPRAERVIRLWAIERDDRRSSRELHLALEEELKGHFPEANVSVTSLTLKAQPEEKEEPEPVSRAESVKAELTSDADTIQEIGDTLNTLKDQRKDLWSSKYPGSRRSLGDHLDEKAEALIRALLHGLKRTR